MAKTLPACLGLVSGLVAGGTLFGVTATGFGIAKGISVGICSTVTAAVEEAVLTENQVDQVLARAAADPGGAVEEKLVGGVPQRDAVL